MAKKSGTALVRAARAKIGDGNGVGMCQKECRTVAGLPSAGDVNGNGRASAYDAWTRCVRDGEVVKTSDPRKVPAGTLVYYKGGTKGDGHVMISVGNGLGVSTDLPRAGRWGLVSLSMPEKEWGMTMVGYVVTYFDGSKLASKPTVARAAKGKTTTRRATFVGKLLPKRPTYVVIAPNGVDLFVGPGKTYEVAGHLDKGERFVGARATTHYRRMQDLPKLWAPAEGLTLDRG